MYGFSRPHRDHTAAEHEKTFHEHDLHRRCQTSSEANQNSGDSIFANRTHFTHTSTQTGQHIYSVYVSEKKSSRVVIVIIVVVI